MIDGQTDRTTSVQNLYVASYGAPQWVPYLWGKHNNIVYFCSDQSIENESTSLTPNKDAMTRNDPKPIPDAGTLKKLKRDLMLKDGW